MTILIVLVAVIVLIVIIAILALHFLRADDSDIFDEIPDEPRRSTRTPAGEPREQAAREQVAAGAAAAARSRPRRPEAVTEAWSADPAVLSPDDRSQPVLRDRSTGPRPVGPQRRGSQAPAAASGRSAKPARAADQDDRTSSWDSMSDVDYWAELSADKPQITPAAAAAGPASQARRGADPKTDPRLPAEGRPAARAEQGPLPVRQRSQPSRTAPPAGNRPADPGQTELLDVRAARGSFPEPATQNLAALARLGDQAASPQRPAPAQRQAQRQPSAQRPGSAPLPGSGQRSPGGQRPGAVQRPGQRALPPAAAAPVSQPTGPRLPMPLDDDPLTSPSFPAINASDSRSYRTRRPSGARPADGRAGDGRSNDGRNAPGFSEPAPQFPRYPAGPDRSLSPPNGYPIQAPASLPAAAMPPAALPPARQQPPVANPYGSYVSAPTPAYQDLPAAQLSSPAPYGYPAGQQASGWYGDAPAGQGGHAPATPAIGHAADGYLPAGHNGAAGYNGVTPPGSDYAGADYSGAGYQGPGYQVPGYPGSQPGPAGYGPQGHLAGQQYDQRGYAAPEPSYGQDGYQGYPGGYGSGR